MNQEVTLRVRQYKPSKELDQFANFISGEYYEKGDLKTVGVIRRAMAEFTNDQNMVMNMQIWTDEAKGYVGHDANGQSMPVVSLHEQYNARGKGDEKIFSILLSSHAAVINSRHHEMKRLNTLADLPKWAYAGQRNYGNANDQVQFVSIYHQISNLLASLSNQGVVYYTTNDNVLRLSFIPASDPDDTVGKFGGWSVDMMVYVPEISVDAGTVRAAAQV